MLESKRGPHRHPDLIREAWAMRFKIEFRKPHRDLPDSLLSQLSQCKNDEARRILLGCTEKEK